MGSWKKTNLTILFRGQVSGNWTSIYVTALNNQGHNAFRTYESKFGERDPGTRPFLWKDNCFTMILPEWLQKKLCNCLDDEGNMIANICPQRGGNCSNYFINESKNIFVSCQNCEFIRKGLPISRDFLPG